MRNWNSERFYLRQTKWLRRFRRYVPITLEGVTLRFIFPIGVHAHGSYSVSTTLIAFVVGPDALGVPVPDSTFSGRPKPSMVVRVQRATGVEFTVSVTVFCV